MDFVAASSQSFAAPQSLIYKINRLNQWLNGWFESLNRFKTIGLNHGLNRWLVVWAKPLGALHIERLELLSTIAPGRRVVSAIKRVISAC